GVAVVAGAYDAVAHRDLEVGAIGRAPVEDQRLGQRLIVAALELADRSGGGRLVGLDHLADLAGLAGREGERQHSEGDESQDALHARQWSTTARRRTSGKCCDQFWCRIPRLSNPQVLARSIANTRSSCLLDLSARTWRVVLPLRLCAHR